ncbi:cysteine hydrolase family protein [Hydrogenimonas sp. SS33]|uniref:cysteine hydrolase family protein n=1 Tax=Hydrogenimonas leucolamina TaxID=2954236 RepID=UPI00336BDF9C
MNEIDAMLIIDMQNDYYPGGRCELEGILPAHTNTLRLIRRAEEEGVERIYVRHIAGGDAPFFARGSEGSELHGELPVQKEDRIVVKAYPNSFRGTGLDAYLKERGHNRILVCGAMTHMCIDTTVRAGYDLGYVITLAHDACATKEMHFGGESIPAQTVHRSFVAALGGKFCRVEPTGRLILFSENTDTRPLSN